MSNNKKIAKFAKYGLALIAAITIATAAQSQQGTMQKVYADETTTTVDATNSRMFYLKYALSDQPEISWMQGAVVGPNGYTVQAPDDVDGYPYYTITGPQGNQYSVGDKITTEEPGLFGHTNPEDDALNYLYYRSDPNASTSEAPAPSTSPSTSEAPAPSTSPSTSEAPAVEKPSQKADDKTTATDKAKADKKADSKPAKTEKSKDANSKKAAATKDNSVANKAAEKSNATSAPTEQAKDTTAKTNNPDTGNSQSIVKEAAGTVDTAAVNHNDSNGFLATLLVSVAAALIGLFQYKKQPKKEK